ncbi:hypothetical protein AVEN_42814-1 [Araneus ventricosus]|uniref:Uncharacterized protein n=1 Tax=Araneus ventricosus TaxID=182803 RepID=A0A4Y2AG99_ARAVE|nr:hypothetical protein AVEN_42814-1 [Araneus ventricosus]
MVVETFESSVHQFIETGREEIRVQVVEPLNDAFLDIGIGSEMAKCQVLLQESEEMKITWCKNRSRNSCAELSSTSTKETLEHPPYICHLTVVQNYEVRPKIALVLLQNRT